MNIRFSWIYLFIIFCLFTHCDKEEASPITFIGDEMPFGNGTANVWYTADEAGTPLEIGMTLTEGALENLPHEDPNDPFANWHVLNFPAEAAAATPFKYMLFSWNQHGHPPMDIYTLPHFDFHFYIQPNEERLAIPPYQVDSSLFLINPPSTAIPADYAKEPGGVPLMGTHWLDLRAGEWNNQPFSYNFLYGSYNGQVTFYEPMITLDVFENIPDGDINEDIRQPELYQLSGKHYPMKYHIKKDTETGAVSVVMSEFVLR